MSRAAHEAYREEMAAVPPGDRDGMNATQRKWAFIMNDLAAAPDQAGRQVLEGLVENHGEVKKTLDFWLDAISLHKYGAPISAVLRSVLNSMPDDQKSLLSADALSEFFQEKAASNKRAEVFMRDEIRKEMSTRGDWITDDVKRYVDSLKPEQRFIRNGRCIPSGEMTEGQREAFNEFLTRKGLYAGIFGNAEAALNDAELERREAWE